MVKLKAGYIHLFIPMEWNMEGFIDMYGMPVFKNPTSLLGIDGEMITSRCCRLLAERG